MATNREAKGRAQVQARGSREFPKRKFDQARGELALRGSKIRAPGCSSTQNRVVLSGMDCGFVRLFEYVFLSDLCSCFYRALVSLPHLKSSIFIKYLCLHNGTMRVGPPQIPGWISGVGIAEGWDSHERATAERSAVVWVDVAENFVEQFLWKVHRVGVSGVNLCRTQRKGYLRRYCGFPTLFTGCREAVRDSWSLGSNSDPRD